MRFRLGRGLYLPLLMALLLVSATAAMSVEAPAAYEHQTWRTENGLPQNSVHSIAQSSDGYIWLATEGGLARFDGLKFVVFDSENTPELRDNYIRFLLATRDGSLWIATADGLTRLQNGSFTCFTTEQGLPGNNVLSLLETSAGALRVVTSDGVAIYQNGRFVSASAPSNEQPASLSLPLAARLSPWLLDKRVLSVARDRSGTIWVGTEKGAARIVGGQLTPVDSPELLSNGVILCLFGDREGDIWVGTDSDGVTIFRHQQFRKYGRNQGLPDDLVRCVFEDSQGTIWAGTNGHGLARWNGRTFSSFTTAEGLSSDVILSLADDSQGDLLAGTPDGLNIIHQNHVRLLTSADGLPDDLVRSIYKDTDGSLWIGTRRGLAHSIAGRITTYTTADGLPSDLVGALLRDKNGVLWVGTLKGLAMSVNGKFSRPAALNQTRADAITSLFEDARGVLWIGTDHEGLIRLTPQKAVQFPAALGLPQTVAGLAEDSSGRLWITSPHGLFRVSRAELDAYADGKPIAPSILSFGTADGLPVNDFSTGGHPTLSKDRRNTLWFATAKGLVSVDASQAAPNPVPPSVVLESVVADDRVLAPSHVAAFAPGLARLAFDYTGLSFAAPQQLRFKYRLEGFDRAWIDAGTRRTAYYTNLPPGRYRFVVRARNGDGVWSANAAGIAFQLRPHFYQTNWFRALLLLAFAALTYSIYRWRVRHVQNQFNAVIAERTRIAREIHDTLAQGFVGVSVQLELVRRLMSTSLDSAHEVLGQAQQLVQQSLAEARRSIWNLRAEPGPDEDLRSKLSNAVQQSMQNHALDVKIDVTGAYRPLPPKIETEVLRIGQEAVRNVVRHANATRLRVTLAFDSTKAQMTIWDDGQGFSPQQYAAAPDGHFGLRGMRERAEAINANLNVTSSAGKGTQVSLELPLK